MIQIQQLKDKTFEEAIKCFAIDEQKKLMNRLSADTSNAYFAVFDSEQMLGISQFNFINATTAIIDCIYITPNERKLKLGDGLLRATLNSIEIRGGCSVIFLANDEEQSFYRHFGFEILNQPVQLYPAATKIASKVRTDNTLMHLPSISEFFSQPCKSSTKR